jgi:hypothetical protein
MGKLSEMVWKLDNMLVEPYKNAGHEDKCSDEVNE